MSPPGGEIPRFLSPPEREVLTARDARQVAQEALGRDLPAAVLVQRRHRNEVFRLGDQALLKLYTRHGEDKLVRKRAAHRRLAGTGLPVPELLATGRLEDRTPWTLETVVPTPQWSGDAAGQAPRHLALGQWLAGLHRLEAPDGPTGGARRAADPVAHARASLQLAEGMGRRVPGGATRVIDRACEDLRGASVEEVFVHGAYSGANVFTEQVDGRYVVAGVIDFEDAHGGDRLEDWAGVALYGLDTPMLRAFAEGYLSGQELGPLPAQRLALWTARLALDTLEWGPRLGDAAYLACAERLLDQLDRSGLDALAWLHDRAGRS